METGTSWTNASSREPNLQNWWKSNSQYVRLVLWFWFPLKLSFLYLFPNEENATCIHLYTIIIYYQMELLNSFDFMNLNDLMDSILREQKWYRSHLIILKWFRFTSRYFSEFYNCVRVGLNDIIEFQLSSIFRWTWWFTRSVNIFMKLIFLNE